MRDFRKFCRPKIKNTSSIGDIILKLKCGTTGTISQEEYNKVKQFFKLESFVGESTSSPGKIKAESKLLGEEAIFDIATYQIIEDSFEIKENRNHILMNKKQKTKYLNKMKMKIMKILKI